MGETLTGSQTVDVRLMTVNAISVRLSEDSQFDGVLFNDLYLPDETFRISPYGFVVPFTLFPGAGLKTVFLQFHSDTDDTSATLSLNIELITDGPVVTAFNLVEGQVISRPLSVNAAATAALGLKEIDFLVDGSLEARTPSSPMNFLWDPRARTSGVVRVEALARDLAGNVATRSVNVVVEPTPPPTPIIVVPASGIVVGIPNVTVSGTAEPGIALRVTRNGAVVAPNVDANVNGDYSFPVVPLVEGPNDLVVTAIDAVGSSPSALRTIFLDSGPPAALDLDPPVYDASRGRLTLTWQFMEEGERPTTFQIFWNETPFATPAEASGQSVSTDETIIVLPVLPDGIYNFGVVGYDDADNPSALSNLEQFTVDFSAPQLSVSYGAALPVGPGTLPITVTTNEALQAPPLLTIRPSGLPPISVPLTGGPLNYTADYAVSDLSARTGNATVTVSGTDLVGNVFVGSPSGPVLVFDLTRPMGTLAFDATPPIQTTSPVLLSIGLTLSEPAAPGTVPSLVFDPPVGSNVPIVLTGSSQNWNGSVTLTPAMGKGVGFFLLNVQDLAGNNGTVLTEGGTIEIYNTADPDPPGIPAGLSGQILAGGEFRIQWTPVPRAETYTIFREPGQVGGTPTIVIVDGLTDPTFTDLPPADGFYRYSIVAVLRGVQGSPSGVLEGFSDRTPPDLPENVNATLLSNGVEVTWTAPTGGDPPARYRVYRNELLIRNLTTPRVVVDLPPRGTFDYSVATVDPYGNENRSATVQIDLLVSPVTNLQLLLRAGQPNAMTWESNDPTVTGFNVYREGVKQNGAPLPDAFYIDSLTTGLDAVTYEVSAVNANGDESVRRSLTAYPLEIKLLVNPDLAKDPQQSRVLYFEDYQFELTNKSPLGALVLKEYEINRTVGGGDALSQSGAFEVMIPPGTMAPKQVILPSPTSRADIQVVQVVLRSEADASGSSVSYEEIFTVDRPVDLGTNILLAPRDPPLAGGLTDFDIQIFNNGYAPIDVILGRANGAEPGDVSIAVLDESGVEVSRALFSGLGVPDVTIDGIGNVFITVLPGNNVTFTLPDVFVPTILAGSGENTAFEVEVAVLYHDLAGGSPIVSGPLIGSTRSNLTETPYYGTSATDQQGYSNSDVIMITGQALDRITGLPVPNVPLRVGFGARGYVLYEEVMTDPNGDYMLEYTPSVGFSGQLNIWAAHPLIVDQLNQVTIDFLRLYVTPQSAEVIMSESDTLDFNLTLINPGDEPLTGILTNARIFIIDEFGVEIDINSIRLEQLGDPVEVDPNKRTNASLQLTADLGAPSEAMLELSLVSDEGASANFTATISLRPAVPTLSFAEPAVGYVDLSANRGEINSQVVILENLGLRPLEGVELVQPQTIPWMSVNLPREPDGRILLPDVPVGGRVTFTVVYTPPPGIELGFYDDFLLIQGTNALADFQVNLFAQVTSNQTGTVKFVFDNIFVEPVPNGKLRLRNPNLRQELGPFYTDANGEFTVPDLQEGLWSWQIVAAGHTSLAGTVDVLANQIVLVERRLSKALVTVEFTVVPVPFTDRYEIVIEQTFQTRVPFPVLVMDPPSFNFQDLPDEFEATVLVTLKNEGLIRMFDCEVNGSSVSEASFLPLINYFPELKAQEQVVVPFKFRFNADGLVWMQQEGMAVSASGVGDAVSDCFSQVFDPTDFLKGLAALAEAAARCQDGAAAKTQARAIVMFAGGFALGASMADPLASVAQFIGCVAGTLLGLGDGGPVGGGGPGGGGGGFVGGSCFPAGTMVTLEDRSTIPIEQLAKGQVVLTSDLGSRTGTVGDVIVRQSDDLLKLTVEPALANSTLPDLSLQLTGDHVVWSDRRGWTAARNLELGEWLHDDHGNLYELVLREAIEGEHTVYTVDVEGDSAFYANHLLVQDLCGYQKTGDRSLFARKKLQPAAAASK